MANDTKTIGNDTKFKDIAKMTIDIQLFNLGIGRCMCRHLKLFFPDSYFDITDCQIDDASVIIKLKSKKRDCECPCCHQISSYYHGTYTRKVQDLPILGKNTTILLNAHEYECLNEACSNKTIVEHFDHFLGYYGRYTERCEDFICTLALETSCEGAARICNYLGIKISGDTIIRLLKKRYSQMEIEKASACIGIDDFAIKKGSTYCTVVCNADSHKPIAILEGRDGRTLKEWLKQNKQVKTITRDRASAYASVIKEELPDAIQIADRFHLHQNLLEAIKKGINHSLPKTIRINTADENNDIIDDTDPNCGDSKKNTC